MTQSLIGRPRVTVLYKSHLPFFVISMRNKLGILREKNHNVRWIMSFWRPAVHALPRAGEGVKVGCDIIEDEPYLEHGRSWRHVMQ